MNNIEINNAFQKKLLDILMDCHENDTDSCTITIDYSKATLEVDMTFRLIPKEVENETDNRT